MQTIVITGSTRGIGLGLAEAFLARGCQVMLNGRTPASVAQARSQLTQKYPAQQLDGLAGDVTDLAAMEQLWAAAAARFGHIHIWINNAGVGHPLLPVWELPPEKIKQVIEIDLLGAIYGARVAIRGMLHQGGGHLYNMEGFGSNGRSRPGLSVYGSSKRALRFLTESLVKETKGTPVKVSALSPGIVITDFLSEQYADDPAGFIEGKRIFNILGDKVETVTPWLADKVLGNNKSGASFTWLTPGMVLWRFATARLRPRDLFSETL
ncbi:MAG: SDR family oxidoreductase [Anaerolineae bacterium]|nr:SDR family oxidoreductase [Anaerolineae bacterium]